MLRRSRRPYDSTEKQARLEWMAEHHDEPFAMYPEIFHAMGERWVMSEMAYMIVELQKRVAQLEETNNG